MPEALTINRLNEITGVDRRTIKKRLTTAGVLQIDGGYPEQAAVKAIFGDVKKKTEDIAISEARIAAANARRAEARADREEGKAIELAIADQAWGEIVLGISQKLDLIGQKFESRYVVGMIAADARDIIEKEIEEIRHDLSKPVSYKKPEGVGTDVEPDVAPVGAEAEAAD